MLRWRGLPLQLFMVVIMPLTLLLLLIAFGSIFLHQRAMRQMVGERDERAVRAAASAISEQLNHRQDAALSLALRAGDLGAPRHVLADGAFLLPDFDGGLALFDSGGALLGATNDDLSWIHAVTVELLAQTAAAEPPVLFSGPVRDPASGKDLLLVSASAPQGISVVGAFSPAVPARAALGDLFGRGDQATAVLTDSQGRLLFQIGAEHAQTADLSTRRGVADALRGDSGTLYTTDRGEERVVAFTAIPPLGWILVLEEPWREVTDPLLRATEWAPLVLAPVLLVTLLGLFFGLRQIIQPLQNLEQKAAHLGWGDYAAIEEPVGGIYEIQRLQSELIQMAQKVRLAQESLRGYLDAVTTGQEEERLRLARELHDDTIQALIALNQRLQLAQLPPAAVGTAVPLSQQLLGMQAMTEQAIADLRRLTRDLRPIYLEDLGVAAALDMLTQDIGQGHATTIVFQVAGDERRLSASQELALYRIGQEALNNVLRHARASEAHVTLTFGPEETVLAIVDNGRGFSPQESPAAGRGHYGLLGIRERAEIIGARLLIESAPGEGTRLTVFLPHR